MGITETGEEDNQSVANRGFTPRLLSHQMMSIRVISEHQVLLAWKWALNSVSSRPETDDGICIFDHKKWDGKPLSTLDSQIIENLAILYLVSQISDFDSVLDMANGGCAHGVYVYQKSMDLDVKGIIDDQKRFRNSLSEHIAFWSRLATETQSATRPFAHSKPNLQPEDKGPDGLFMALGDQTVVEIQEVKNTQYHPSNLIANSEFRANGRVRSSGEGKKTGKILVDFWLFANEIVGFYRLDFLLDQVCRGLNLTAPQSVRAGLLVHSSYNAVMVADDNHARSELFECFVYVTDDVQRRIVTYIGTVNWSEIAEAVRKRVINMLKATGVW